MANVIKIKYSDTATNVPGSLAAGELAINRADKKLFYTDNANVVQSMSLVPGAGSVNIKQTEVDFGAIPLKNKKFTITDAEVGAVNQIIASVSYDDPTGGQPDDAEWFEDLMVMARAGVGQFFLYCNSPWNDLDGKVKINYLIG